jgi:hypothetical protein
MSSFVSQIMAPGGGVMLLPFVRLVIGILLILTITAAVLGVARIHMMILSVLSAGTLFSGYYVMWRRKEKSNRSIEVSESERQE